jgi:NAD(P)-dependent dehydrogenase (short-subunit alcohol dehydrogenase family)
LAIPGLVPVCPLDLARREHIPAVHEVVLGELERRQLEGLYAIVNNAGGGGFAPLEFADLDRFQAELQTRILGPLALLQAFLPLIRRARGRVVWIATPALLPIPFVGAIHICDFAVNGLARTLELELKPWGIPNILIRCGGIKTAAVTRTGHDLDSDFDRWPPECRALYAKEIRKQEQGLAAFDRKRTSPEKVAEVIERALCAARPKRRYQVGYMSGFAALLELFPQPVVDWVMAKRL